MILVVDCCVRGEDSATKKLYESYLRTLGEDREVEILSLPDLDLAPLRAEDLKERDRLLENKETGHEMFRYARQFREAEEIVVAAPYWDLSFPSLLKVYLEHVSVNSITFGYEGSDCVGYCKASRLLYFSTCGGFTGERHLGAEYVKALGAMFGIREFHAFTVEGMDIDPARREAVLEAGIARIREEVKNLI